MHDQQHQLVDTRRLSTNNTTNDAVNQANEVGASVRKTIKKLRGGSDKFYRDLITAVKILLCEQKINDPTSSTNPKIRYVDANDSLAYKDDRGNCIRITLSAASDNTTRAEYTFNKVCEVKPNCYWAAINTTVDVRRIPVYALDQSTPPADGSMTYNGAKHTAAKWTRGLMVFALPGIILAGLSLLTMIFFLLCRCCCDRCGGRSPKAGGYTCTQKFLPVLFFLLFATGIVVVTVVSLTHQKTVTAAVADVFNATFVALWKAKNLVNNIQAPLEKIRDKVVTSAASVSLQLGDTSFIDGGINGLTSALGDFETGSANRTVPDGCTVKPNYPYCVACTACTTISAQVATARKQIEDNAGSGVAALRDVKMALTSKLVNTKDTMRSLVNEQVENTDKLVVMIADTRVSVDDAYTTYEDQKVAQWNGVLFTLALAVVALGLIGVLFGLTPLKVFANIIHLAYVVGFVALIVTFLASAIALAVSVMLGDACEVASIFTEDWSVPLGDTGKGVNACFRNESLIDALGLSSSLAFARGGITFPNVTDTNKLLNFSSLDKFATSIQGVDLSTFSIDQASIDKAMALLNKYTKQSEGRCLVPDGNYKESNILVPWTANKNPQGSFANGLEYIIARYKPFELRCVTPGDGIDFKCIDASGNPVSCAFHTFVGDLYTKVSALVAVKVNATAFLSKLKTNMTKITDTTATFKIKTKSLNANVTAIKSDLERNLIKDVGEFEKAMYCPFVKDSFFEIYNALCGDIMPAFTMISFVLFLAGIFLLPVTICLILALKRLKARGNGIHVADSETRFK